MSTALAVHPPSHNSPLRHRESDKTITSSPLPQAATTKTTHLDMRRSISSGSSARAARNNASRSPSREGPSPRRTNLARSQGSRSPAALHPGSQNSYPGPTSNQNSSPNVPVIKKELPSSPESASQQGPIAQSRHRPRKLDLTRNKNVPQGASTVGARPNTALTSKDSGNLSALHGVGIACLSPGFQTHDPSMREGIARSMEMRDQQRQIIEARLHGKPLPEQSGTENGPQTGGLSRGPPSSKRKGPPPGLSINAPSPHQFASEPRVIQSAPLGQSFTGLHPKGGASLSRQVLDRQSSGQHLNAGTASNNHGPPLAVASSSQTTNRLPPISDVFASENLGSARRTERDPPHSGFHAPHSTYSPAHPGPLPSPGYPAPPASAGLHPPRSHPGGHHEHHSSSSASSQQGRDGLSHRQREFKSAEEAVHSLSGGREDLLPKIVHYGGHQPPTPGSPPRQSAAGATHAQAQAHAQARPGSQIQTQSASLHPDYAAGPRSGSGRRRNRDEYERDAYLDSGDRMDIDPRERSERDRDADLRERERERGPRTGGDVGAGPGPATGNGERRFFGWEEERGRRAGPLSAGHPHPHSHSHGGGHGQHGAHLSAHPVAGHAHAQGPSHGQGQAQRAALEREGQASAPLYAPFSGLARDFREREREYEGRRSSGGGAASAAGPRVYSGFGGPPSSSLAAANGAGGRDSPESQRRKREEFMGLCARAWDLMHS